MNAKVVFLAVASVLNTALLFAREKPNTADLRQIAANEGRLLELGHYSRWKLGPEMSERILETYLQDLDSDKLFFTQDDVNRLRARYGTSIGKAVLLGDLGPAKAIYALFKARVEERTAKVRPLVWKSYNFTSNRFINLDIRKKPWPANIHEADSLWANRIESELLQEKLNKLGAARSGPEVVAHRYNELLKDVEDRGEEDIDEIFLNAVAESYDPHSEYMGHSNLESFEIDQRLSLVGIGVETRYEDGYVKIQRLEPGGPAAKSGKISAGDRIVAIAQGKGPFVDTSNMELDKVAELMRGKKGTLVRLQVLPAGTVDPSKRRAVALVRDTVKLTDQEANAQIIDKVLPDGSVRRLGWITLPSFYQGTVIFGMGKSASRDVAALLRRLNREKIQGLVLDLRSNGGGSLDEAIRISGLFINQGPIVQVKDADGTIHVLRDHEGKALYTGPMIVLVNKLSASASELFAAAMQDYGRALIVGGSSTFGKGTVQSITELGRPIPLFGVSPATGALYLTVQKFYRVTGGSTQLRGVIPDLKLPSVLDNAEYGESTLNHPLPYDHIEPVPIELTGNHQELFKSELRERSAARLRHDPQFQDIAKDVRQLKERLKNNRLSLNQATRWTEIANYTRQKEDEEAERRNAERTDQSNTYELNLAYVNKPHLPLLKKALATAKPAPGSYNPVDEALDEGAESDLDKSGPAKKETLNILSDLIGLSKSSRPLGR